MKMLSVESTNLDSIGYDGMVLRIKLKDGNIHDYSHVPRSVYKEFINSNSLGSYYHVLIKGTYAHRKFN